MNSEFCNSLADHDFKVIDSPVEIMTIADFLLYQSRISGRYRAIAG
jgi:hypothetical protein